jgi:4-hydroxybenzoate polyprenyltransferase
MTRVDADVTTVAPPAPGSPPAEARKPALVLLVREMRPRQWSKNLILFAGLIFSKNLMNPSMALRALAAFGVFCLLSGMVYTINDLLDMREDRMHETKRRRPLASGALSPRLAAAWLVLVAAVAFGAAALVGQRFLLISVGFLAFNLAYSLYLKNVVIVDVISISISFIIRAIAGVVALNTLGVRLTISPWLLVVTFFLSLFLGLCKRRHEFMSMNEAGKHRRTLDAYSRDLLDQLINMAATAALLAYSIYTIWPDTVEHFGTDGLMYTIPIVVVGLTRYMFLVFRRNLGGDPSEMLLTERSLWGTVAAWFVCVALIIYGARL